MSQGKPPEENMAAALWAIEMRLQNTNHMLATLIRALLISLPDAADQDIIEKRKQLLAEWQ